MADFTAIFPSAAQLDRQNDILLHIANKMGAYDAPMSWGAVQDLVRAGLIGNYVQAGDQMQANMSAMATATVSGTGITSAAVDTGAFTARMGSDSAAYVFTYSGGAWTFGGAVANLAAYGIAPVGTPAEGDAITVTVTSSVIDFDVEGLDEECPAQAGRTHVLSILMHPVFSSLQFDNPQYLYAVTAADWPSGLPAGTYNIVLDHAAYNGGTGEDGSYQFTTTQPVPVGGGIRHTAIGKIQTSYVPENITGGTFETYGADTKAVIETGIACTAGNSGTNLGTTTASVPSYKVGNAMNYSTRQYNGSNRWSTSYLRQVLNSDDATVQFVPATVFSRDANIAPEGFLHALDPALRAVLGPVRKRYALPTCDGGGYEDIADTVTLNTRLDVYGAQTNSIDEGPVDGSGTVMRTSATGLWKNTSDADKIKYLGSVATRWWISSAVFNNAYIVGAVNTNGAFNTSSRSSATFGVVPSLHVI